MSIRSSDVAERLGVPRSTIWRWREAGVLAWTRPGIGHRDPFTAEDVAWAVFAERIARILGRGTSGSGAWKERIASLRSRPVTGPVLALTIRGTARYVSLAEAPALIRTEPAVVLVPVPDELLGTVITQEVPGEGG